MDEDTMSLCSDAANGADDGQKLFSERKGDAGQNSVTDARDSVMQEGNTLDAHAGQHSVTDDISMPDSITPKADTPTQNAESLSRETESAREIPDFSELLAALSDTRSHMETLIAALASVPRLDTYETELNILRASVAQNQRNEERLYKDLDAARKDEHFTIIRPFLEFLITMHTEILKFQRQYQEAREEFNNEELWKEILGLHDYFINMIQHQLNFQGVEIVSYEPDTPFSPVEHAMIRTAPTSDPGQNAMIASAETFGYRYDGKILRRARVVVYKYSHAPEESQRAI